MSNDEKLPLSVGSALERERERMLRLRESKEMTTPAKPTIDEQIEGQENFIAKLDNPDGLRMARAILSTLEAYKRITESAEVSEPVARVKRNSGCSGREFIGESLEFRDLPVGTKLYTAPPSGVREPDAAHLQTIDERDAAEEAVSDIYYRITGRSPEWSNLFGFEQAIDEIQDAFDLVRAVAKSNTAPQSGVREGMLRAAEICKRPKPDCCGRFESDDNSMNLVCCGKLEPGEFMDGLECSEAITRAADQVNVEGKS